MLEIILSMSTERKGFEIGINRIHIIKEYVKRLKLSEEERQRQMEKLKRSAIMAMNPREGITAVQALAAFGEDAIPRLLAIGVDSSLANDYVREAAISEIKKLKRHSM
jgi:hypothetical protein